MSRACKYNEERGCGRCPAELLHQRVALTNCSSVEDGLPLDLKVVEFDGIVVEDLLPLLLREVGDQLLQQVNHLQNNQISDGKLSSTKISLKTKIQQQLFQ